MVHYLPLGDDPKTLDPVRATDTISFSVLTNIVSTAYEYDYLKRPVTLVPLSAVDMPIEDTIQWKGRLVYRFRFKIRNGLHYAADRCFGDSNLSTEVGPEVNIDDYIFTIKRTADRSLSPYAYPLLERIVGFTNYADKLDKLPASKITPDRYQSNIEGVRKWGNDGIEILLDEPDLQLIYFFAIGSSAPIPETCYWNMLAEGRSLDREMPASGAFYLKEWKLQSYIVLKKNPGYADFQSYKFEKDSLPEELPRLDEVILTKVSAGPTMWRLFRQGYFDRMSVGQDTFDQVFDGQQITDRFKKQGIYSDKANELATYGWVFNLNDSVVGSNVWLRRAVACSFDIDEMIDRFYKNRAIKAFGLIPPGIEGGTDRLAPIEGGTDRLAPIEGGKSNSAGSVDPYYCKLGVPLLLEKAGYKNGIDPKTGGPLELRMLNVARSGSTAIFRYYSESAQLHGWSLKIDLFDAPTYFEKRMKREFQISSWGWGADYADPQNFYQLFYGPNSKTTLNESGYSNLEFDSYYRQMVSLRPGPKRELILSKMDSLLKEDVPVIFSHHPILYSISWPFLEPMKPHPVDFNQLKYRKINPELRNSMISSLNPVFGGGF